MPNQLTGQVSTDAAYFDDTKIRRGMAAGATTYVTGQMIGVNVAGYGCHCDDTAGVTFDGILFDTQGVEVVAADANGDKVANVARPWRFSMKTSAPVTAADLRKKVFAKFNNEVSIAATTNSVFVGWIDAILQSGAAVRIAPVWAPLALS